MFLYAIIAALAAGTVMKLVAPLLGGGRYRTQSAPVSRADRRLAALLAFAVPVLALVIYLFTGRPDLPGAPAIFIDPGELLARQEALLAKRPMETLLLQNPDNLNALAKLSGINQRLGRFAEAAKFMQRVVIIAQTQDNLYLRLYAEDLGRLQVLANNGKVGTDALGTFTYVRTLSDTDPIARYYQALAKAQAGNTDAAIDEWNDLLSTGATGAYWKEYVRQAIAATRAGRLGEQPINIP